MFACYRKRSVITVVTSTISRWQACRSLQDIIGNIYNIMCLRSALLLAARSSYFKIVICAVLKFRTMPDMVVVLAGSRYAYVIEHDKENFTDLE